MVLWQCRWTNLTTVTTCGQCSAHRYADLIPDDAEQRCGCGGMLEINRKNVHVDDATATGTVERVCDRCPAGSTHLWALDDSDYRMIFGRDFGSDD